MKKIITVFCFLLFCFSKSFSQKINFEKSFAIAKEKALNQNKILFVKINFPPNSETYKFETEITFPDVVNKFNSNFVNYKGDISDTSMTKILRKYSINKFPALLFFDLKGGLITKETGVFTQSDKYLELANRVLSLSKEKSIIEFDAEYKKGDFDGDFLKRYISKRMQLGIKDNASLADQYVEFLKVSELNNYDEVLFILKAGPLAYGKAHRLVSINNQLIDSIYKTEILSTRLEINNAIINNTMIHAISKKNIAWATAASNFTRTTWGKDYREAQKQSSLKMLNYYKGIKDSANYLRNAIYFYDQHYMNISKDSVDKKKIKNFEQVKNDAIASAKLKGVNITTYTQTSTITDDIPTELNNVAYDFFLTGTRNLNYINKAITWSKRSLEFNQVYGFYDTLAHLLYRLDYFAEAEFNQNKAIELAKAKQINTNHLQEELMKIKNRTL